MLEYIMLCSMLVNNILKGLNILRKSVIVTVITVFHFATANRDRLVVRNTLLFKLCLLCRKILMAEECIGYLPSRMWWVNWYEYIGFLPSILGKLVRMYWFITIQSVVGQLVRIYWFLTIQNVLGQLVRMYWLLSIQNVVGQLVRIYRFLTIQNVLGKMVYLPSRMCWVSC